VFYSVFYTAVATFGEFGLGQWGAALPLHHLLMLLPILAIVMTCSIIFTFTDFQLVYTITRGGSLNSTPRWRRSPPARHLGRRARRGCAGDHHQPVRPVRFAARADRTYPTLPRAVQHLAADRLLQVDPLRVRGMRPDRRRDAAADPATHLQSSDKKTVSVAILTELVSGDV
jgi:hypothetical protein